jgi:hypothetical protein
VFHSLLYRSNRPSGVLCVASAPDEHHANDAGPELDPPPGGGGALADIDVGTGDGFEDGPDDDGCGAGCDDDGCGAGLADEDRAGGGVRR